MPIRTCLRTWQSQIEIFDDLMEGPGCISFVGTNYIFTLLKYLCLIVNSPGNLAKRMYWILLHH